MNINEELVKLMCDCDVSGTGDISVEFSLGEISLENAVKDLISMAIETNKPISEKTKDAFITAYTFEKYVEVLNLMKKDLTD